VYDIVILFYILLLYVEIDQLVSISGMVIRTSNIMPEMREGYFKCSVCEHGAKAEIDRGKILEPVLCPNCNTNFAFSLIHNRSSFADKQLIRLQEDLGMHLFN
jgi:DNA replication licensing factor MCM4